MLNRFFLFVFALLMGGMASVTAKIIYVPLYIVDTQTDVKEVKRTSAVPLFITQDDHRLTLPLLDNIQAFRVLKDSIVEYETGYQTSVELPATLVGDYEVRLCSDTYYYHGYITLDSSAGADIPSETAQWEDISLFGSNTSLQVILENILGLNVVEYTMKMYGQKPTDEDLVYLSEEERENYIRYWEEREAEQKSQRHIGLLADELREVFPQVVYNLQEGEVGINYIELVPVLICCIQELKIQLDSRTEQLVDALLSRGADHTTVNAARTAIGNALLSVAPTPVGEPSLVRYLLAEDTEDARLVITNMGGQVMAKKKLVPSDTSTSIDSRILTEGIYLCTLFANGRMVGTKRLVKTK